jgi:group I intron endonuclease
MKIFIYSLSHPITNEIRYIGKTVNIKQRYKDHLYRFKKDRKSQWIKSLLRENLKPIMQVIEECSPDNWEEREKYWITQFDNLTNLTEGGGKHRMTEETKEKIRKAMLGKPKSEQTKEKLRLANLGKNNPSYGISRKCSEETKAKLRKAVISKYPPKVKKEQKKSCVINGIFYISVSEAARQLNLTKGNLSFRIRSKNYPNYIWKDEFINLPLSCQ